MSSEVTQKLEALDGDYKFLQNYLIESKETVMGRGVLGEEDEQELLAKLRERLDKSLTGDILKQMHDEEGRQKVLNLIREEVNRLGADLPNTMGEALEEIASQEYHRVAGLGIIQELLDREDIKEIWVIKGREIWYQPVRGEKVKWDKEFDNPRELTHLIERVTVPIGKRVNEVDTMCDAYLPDMTRIQITLGPTAVDGPAISIRKHPKQRITYDDMIKSGTVGRYSAILLPRMVDARFNTGFTGGTGSGKTTMMNAVINLGPPNYRYITMEDRLELILSHPHVVRMVTREAGPDGSGATPYKILVKATLSMTPDSFALGEARDEALFYVLDAANTGHEFITMTLHTGSSLSGTKGEATVSRMMTLALRAAGNISERVVADMIANGVQVDVHTKLYPEGHRVERVSGIFGLRDGRVWVEDVILYDESKKEEYLAPGPGPGLMAKLLELRYVAPPEFLRGGVEN